MTVEGPEETLFGAAHVAAPVPAPGGEEETAAPVVETVREEIVQVVADGFDVDDDNLPAPENIPDPTDNSKHQQEWGWDGICRRRQAQNSDHPAYMKGQTDATIKTMTLLSMFLYWFPTDWLVNVLLQQTNNRLANVAVP